MGRVWQGRTERLLRQARGRGLEALAEGGRAAALRSREAAWGCGAGRACHAGGNHGCTKFGGVISGKSVPSYKESAENEVKGFRS